MTTRRTTFTRTPFVITAFLAANLAVTGAPLVAMAEEGVPQENPPAAEQQPEQQAPEQLQTQQAPEPNLETQAGEHYKIEGTKLTITDNLTIDSDFDGENPKWKDQASTITEVVFEEAVTTPTYTNLFSGFEKLESLDLTNLSLAEGGSGFDGMFENCKKLAELTLPKGFEFKGASTDDPKLPGPTETGIKWSNGTDAKSTTELVALYVGEKKPESLPDKDYTWKWQKKAKISVTTEAVSGEFVYNGEEHKPTPGVTVTADEVTLETSDFTIEKYTYANNVHASTDSVKASVTPTVKDAHDGKGYYIWDSVAATAAEFKIEQRKVNIIAKNVTMVYDGYKDDAALAKLSPKITYESVNEENQTGIIEKDKDKVALSAGYSCKWERKVGTYDIEITSVRFNDKDSSSSSSSSSVAPSADDTSVAANYTAGDLTNGKLKVTAADISNATVFAVSDRTYTGKAFEPTPTVKMDYSYTEDGTAKSGSTQLTKDTDYTLSYANNTQVGQATITIKGKGNFTGTKTVNFNIKSASSTSGSSTTSSTTSSTSATPSTADPTSVTGIGSLLASGIAALGAARFTRKRKN